VKCQFVIPLQLAGDKTLTREKGTETQVMYSCDDAVVNSLERVAIRNSSIVPLVGGPVGSNTGCLCFKNGDDARRLALFIPFVEDAGGELWVFTYPEVNIRSCPRTFLALEHNVPLNDSDIVFLRIGSAYNVFQAIAPLGCSRRSLTLHAPSHLCPENTWTRTCLVDRRWHRQRNHLDLA